MAWAIRGNHLQDGFMNTVSLVEDDVNFSMLLTRSMSRCKGVRLISTHSTGEEALKEIPKWKPDVVLMDIKLPGMNGIECLRRLMKLSPKLLCHVLMLTEYEDNHLVFEALKAGASGYVLKDRISVRQLSVQIKDVAAGGAVMSPKIARKVIGHFHCPASSGLEALSTRELEVLAHLADGLMYKQIAGMLHIAENTVRRHVSAIYSKLHVQCRAHAARQYFNRPGR
jgi:DNA-binding NarL/FixJ family response regulator